MTFGGRLEGQWRSQERGLGTGYVSFSRKCRQMRLALQSALDETGSFLTQVGTLGRQPQRGMTYWWNWRRGRRL